MRRRLLAVAALAAVAAPLLASGTAEALPPSKTGWWNAASAAGFALPQPTTAAGDLHVGQGASSPTAYAAVGYDLAGQTVTAAVLELKLTNVVGTPSLAACATKDDSWKAAEDGAIADAPAYDCAKAGVSGILSATGDTVTFLLDERLQLSGGYSLAIVPDAGATPFQVDLVKPDAASLTLTSSAPSSTPDLPTSAAGGAAVPPAAGGGTTPVNPGSVAVPQAAGMPAAPAPALAPPAVAAPQAPAVAPSAPVASRVPLPPLSNKDRYVAGSLLALLAGALVWALQQPLPTPRLIGGLARVAGGGAGPADGPADGPVRGIGRFASVRATPARRLV